jgi:hypothetical protein
MIHAVSAAIPALKPPLMPAFPSAKPLPQSALNKNVNRRHLDESQRAMVSARLANLEKGQKKSDRQICLSQSEAADKLNIGRQSIICARKVLDSGVPALVRIHPVSLPLPKPLSRGFFVGSMVLKNGT